MNDELDLLASLAGKRGKKKSSSPVRARFEASIIATYNAYLPFYEDVVLRRLVASGCQHNVLLLDAARLSESLESATGRPRFAGQSYSLLPIRAPGAFHPKLAILVGRRHARLVIGSHNVTLAGFGHNRELSTELDLPRGKDDPNASVIIAAWRFLEKWLQRQAEYLPKPVIDAATRVASRFAPWLREDQSHDGPVRFLGSSPEGPNLWEDLKPLLNKRPTRLVILGPFFDHGFHFLHAVRDEFNIDEIIVGIEPDKVVIGDTSARPDGVRFVDASQIARGEGYLHAKVLFAEFRGRDALLVTGSANPSRPAWIENPGRRNAEAVLVHVGSQARTLADQLGVTKVPSMPELSEVVWNAIQSRADEEQPEFTTTDSPTLAFAVIDEDTIVVRCNEPPVDLALCYGAYDRTPFAESSQIQQMEDGFRVNFPNTDLSAAAFLELLSSEGKMIRAVVHHPMAIARLSRTSSQQRFREALDSLDSDSPDLPTVIRLAGKLIFDGDDVDKHASTTGAKTRDRKEDGTDDTRPIKSLIVESRSTKRRRRRMRELSGGDLGYIIDTLIYRLGVGLRSAAEQLEHEGPSEEEQINADDDAQPPEEAPTKDLVKVCHGKVGTLVTRMLNQLKRAHKGEVAPAMVVEQLLAVLAVLREVRRQDGRLASVTGGESLVPARQRQRLVDGALKHLFEREKDLYAKALEAFEDDPEGDLPRLRGLLLWLAWDAGLDARIEQPAGETYEQRKERLFERAKLATLVPIVTADDAAVEEARWSIWRKSGDPHEADARLWLDAHLRWGRAILDRYRNRHTWTSGSRKVEPGSLALAKREPVQRLRLLLHAHHDVARLIDIGESTGDVGFSLESVSFAETPACQ